MKLVKEHINFKRGLDPKEAMTTGMAAMNQKIYDTIYSLGIEDSWVKFIDKNESRKYNYIKILIPTYYFGRRVIATEVIDAIKNLHAPNIGGIYKDYRGDVVIKLNN